MLISIKMNPATPTPLDDPDTDAAAVSKVSASDANLPSGPVVNGVEEVKVENPNGLLAVM